MIAHGFIGGDGGPIIVLQASVAHLWKGADDFENSLMNGGELETDYDVICNSEDHILNRYDRDMLVLDDSEWCAHVFTLSSGAIAIIQQFVGDNDAEATINRAAQALPSNSFLINIQDASLRLLVGADNGNGDCYDYKDVPITPGAKRCDVFLSPDELIVVIF